MMININFTISLIQYVKKNKSCPLTLLLTHRKLSSHKTQQRIDFNTTCINQINPELNENKERVQSVTNSHVKEKKREFVNFYMQSYVNHVNTKGNIYPRKFMKIKKKYTDILYLIDKKDAKKFTDLIIDDLSKNMTYVAEANPGTGVLTEQLLKAGVNTIHGYEPNKCFHPILNELKDTYPNRFHLKTGNLFNISKLYYMDCLDKKQRVETLLEDIKKVSWEDNTCMQVIGAVANIIFLKHLILSVVFQSCLMSRGRTCFYLVLPPSIWHEINSPQSTGRMHYRYIMFKTLFNCNYLGDLNRISYIPWIKENASGRSFKEYFKEKFYIVKIEPKIDIFKGDFQAKHLMLYWYFVKRYTKTSKQRVIPELERCIPGCGYRLIQLNYNIYTRFIDLSPYEILNLYNNFRSWPEYKSSLFVNSAENYIQSIQQNKHISCIEP